MSFSRSRSLLFGAAFIMILTSCGDLGIGSPVSVEIGSLSDRIEEREALREPTPAEVEAALVLDELEPPPEAIAFAEVLESGEVALLNIDAGERGAALHTGPGTSFPQLSTLAGGSDIQATGDIEGNWALISYQGLDGWVRTSLLTTEDLELQDLVLPEPDPDAPSSSSAVLYRVNSRAVGVNIRSSPGLDSTVLGSAPTGAEVTATGNTSGSWVQISYQGMTGWSSSNYIDQL